MENYVIGSHNAWSYLPAKKWWMKPFSFMARCQDINIKDQYSLGVRCFDLRIKFKDGQLVIAHGSMIYKYSEKDLETDLVFINSKGDCSIRLIHEIRNKEGLKYTDWFKNQCAIFESTYKNIKFWCGKNLYNWETDYKFEYNPICDEKYSSVCPPKYIDDWWPWLFAKFHNDEIKAAGTDKDILLIDYVDIG